MSSKPKELYRETYKAGSAMVRKDLLPDRLPYMNKGFRIVSMEMRAAGKLDNGQEFQEIRICLEETEAAEETKP